MKLVLENRLELMKVLNKSKRIQYLLNEAIETFGNPVSMHNMINKTMIYTKNVITDDPYYSECVTYGVVSHEAFDPEHTKQRLV